MDTNESKEQPQQFPPVIAVLGHVDHGKTSLLDAVRKTSIASREFGGITQKIGASSVEIVHDGVKRRITFIDTPGHQAFAQMRSRGAQAADICLLIVSAIDGVMPQTKESIEVLKAAKIPYIVVLTMSDMPTKNPEKAKQQLLRENILLEGMGGDIPVIEISSKTNHNIQELLDLILLLYDMRPVVTRSADHPFKGTVIESKRDPKIGPRATVICKDGSLRVRDELSCDGKKFRVRSILNTLGKQINIATIGEAVELVGMDFVPGVGSIMQKENSESTPLPSQVSSVEAVYSPSAVVGNLAVILVADTEGSLEAIKASLPKEVIIISQKTGEVSEADILLAKSTRAIVLSFSSRIRPDVAKLAMTEKVLAKNYQIIYEMLDEIADVLEGKKLAEMEQIYGVAQILAKFPFEKTFAFGVKVVDGRIARGDKVRVVRGENTIGETSFSSMRVAKSPTSKVEKGNEAGVVVGSSLDIQVGDVLVCHS